MSYKFRAVNHETGDGEESEAREGGVMKEGWWEVGIVGDLG